MSETLLAIDAGTTGIRVFSIGRDGRPGAHTYREFTQHYPQPGWVEHDAAEIWRVTKELLHELTGKGDPAQIAGIGITNQRETTVVWDATTGEPLAPAIVWQDRRTAPLCHSLKEAGHEALFHQRTGLTLDAYFSGTKLRWLHDNVPAVAAAAKAGTARFGTIDSWLLWKLTDGAVHATDYTNASRTLMYDIVQRRWDKELLGLLGIPDADGLLPQVHPSSHIFGTTHADLLGREIPIAGIAGDQQAALFGQGCVRPGQLKNTYGTGCFALVNCGTEARFSDRGLLTTLACDEKGQPAYALEGSVFIAGAVIQWLRDELGLLSSAGESEAIAASVDDTQGVYLVPAFVGLGAPYWDMDARGTIVGLTRGANRAHLVRAALESIAYQTRDLIEAFEADAGAPIDALAVDGGAVVNDLLMQFQADILGRRVLRPADTETTVLGAAYLAGLATGFWNDFSEIDAFRSIERSFEPTMESSQRASLYQGWQAAVARARSDR